MTLRPLEDGNFSGTVGTLRDISRQRRRQQILNNSGNVSTARTVMRATSDIIDDTRSTMHSRTRTRHSTHPASTRRIPNE